jgi:light-regulated signal transduction histidine kinase (bacteriophytochrome)
MISVIPVTNDKDVVMNWIGFMVDIHAQKEFDQTVKDNQQLKVIQEELVTNQEELQAKIIELNRSNYELEQFAHLATHDLQEPLRKLFFYSDVLKTKYADKIDESGLSLLKNMTTAAARMKELITDLLNYSRLHQQKIEFETVDLNLVLEDILKDFEISIQEKSAGIEIDALPSVKGNSSTLRQLFGNLISNALKYSRKEVPIRIQITTLTDNNNAVIKVKDNGIGFKEEYQERIFGLFERLHTRDEFPGTGIGLSICRKIVELHHGTISATSTPGDHSTFEVSLPLS